jgi:hypothetical protein
MSVQILRCLKPKYLLFFSAQWVSRYAGMDVIAKILGCRVEHRYVRSLNLLWNPEIRNVMLVDFERSEILK